ncbi:hypothetical protein [Bacillus sp. FJAT-29814]|uniref:hypothetical protein n=1 Tax=Bacillus sp. FJAT-29814 TaxID=1729688 RepID=UPI0008319FB0|nr:hypothetical protein [Bacillus sp. FJAT-29814]
MGLDQMFGLLGLLLGGLGGAFGWWWGRRQAARKRGLDERYNIISTKSLAASWKITLVAIYILFILLNFGMKLTAAPVLGILLLIHMAGWTFSIIYYNLKI